MDPGKEKKQDTVDKKDNLQSQERTENSDKKDDVEEVDDFGKEEKQESDKKENNPQYQEKTEDSDIKREDDLRNDRKDPMENSKDLFGDSIASIDPPRNDDLGNDPKDPIKNVKEPSDDFVPPVDPPRNDDLGNDPKDPTKNPNDPSGDSVLPADSLRNDNLGNDTSDSIRENLWNELNSQLDEQQERKEHREEFQQNYSQEDVDALKYSDPDQYDRIMAANRMATREEIDEAAGGDTCWDNMSTEDKLEMLHTNPERGKALQQDYEDRHPRGMDKDDPDFDEKLMHEKQQDSKEKRDRNDGIPQDMLDSKDPYQEFTSADQTDTNRT